MELQKNPNGGYNQIDVDAYVEKVAKNYTLLYEAYIEQKGQIEELKQDAQASKDENARLVVENEKLRQTAAAPAQPHIDTTTVARLMLDAEIFAKQIEERAISEANKKLAEKEAQIRVLELQKEGALSSIRQLANDLTALTTVGGQESAFAERNQPGSHKEHGGQQFTFVSASVPGAGGYFPRIESNSDTA